MEKVPHIEKLLEISVKKQASDLHLVPDLPPILRIHGVLIPLKEFDSFSDDENKMLIYSLMTEEQIAAFEKNLVIEMAISLPKIGNFRVSVIHQLNGITAVFRVIPPKVPTFEEIGLPIHLQSLLLLQYGLVLVTGPTGSGKTTTLAAMINYINRFRSCNIITIEDPIEFVHTSKKSIISQIQIGRDTPDFATALRASLRQDPNVILLGELRDLETMRLALVAAETGHLVLATLHASSSPLAINRFVDVFPSEEKNRVRNLLAETLQGVICQTLVKRIAGGRAAAFEIMLATSAIRHFIRQDMNAHMESTIQTSGDKGMCTLEFYLNEMVTKQIITTNTARNALYSRQAIRDSAATTQNQRKF